MLFVGNIACNGNRRSNLFTMQSRCLSGLSAHLSWGALGMVVAMTLSLRTSRAQGSAALPPIALYDLAPTDRYDLRTERGKNNAWAEVHAVAALQGLVNRHKARLYVTYVTDNAAKPGEIDRFWLENLRSKGGWLAGRSFPRVIRLESLVQRFRGDIQGVVLYDLKVPATSNVASTVAGCDGLLPIPYDPTAGSVYDRLVLHSPHLPIKLRLLHADGTSLFTGKESGSAKCDAYLWAKRRYLDTGKCDPTVLAYYIDSWWLNAPTKAAPNCHGLSNHDYFVSRKGFFFDLSPWEDELPQDDLNQPAGTDYRTLAAILRSAYNRTQGKKMILAGGFIPWAWKYTQTAGGRHGDVPTEWRYAAVLSCFNAYMDADALGLNAMANASLFQHFPLKATYAQKRPAEADWKTAGYLGATGNVIPKTYITFYVGDYDSAAWLYHRLPGIWNDPTRGTIPLGWAFDPNLADRFPVGLEWTRRTATPNDHFMSGDSGAGYLNPGFLDGDRPFSGLPSGLDVWSEHCRKYYHQWDLSLTGFVIDGDSRAMSAQTLAAYAKFSPDGVVAQRLPGAQGLIPGTETPYRVMGSDMPNGDQTDEAFARIRGQISGDSGTGPHFHIFRTILWSPSQHKQLFDRLKQLPNVEVVDPYTLMGLLRKQMLRPAARKGTGPQ